MTALSRLRVAARKRDPDDLRHVADADLDFELEDAGTVEDPVSLLRPGVSLFALDSAHGGVTFVETPAGVDLLEDPFLHRAQRASASHVIRVPFDVLPALADALPPAGPPILIHSVGRCGSTLVSSMLRQVPGVASLSEPDVFTSIETAVADGEMTADEAAELLGPVCRLAASGLAPAGSRAAIKFRSEVVWMAHLLDRAEPDARVVFLYRDARRVIESYLRVLGRDPGWSARLAHVPGLDGVVARRHARRVEKRGARMDRFAYVLDGCSPLEVEKRGRWGKFLIQWLAKVHHYLRLHEQRDGVAALRYEDLIADPGPAVVALFAHCGLSEDALPAALEQLGRDSQKGTTFERGSGSRWRMSARDEREMQRTFDACTALSGPDVELPGTLG